jgi:predicted Holliday junction resolvase-like endonuclease
MFNIFSGLKLFAILATILVVVFGLYYVSNLKANLAIAQENSKKLTEAVATQQETIEQIRREQIQIANINSDLRNTIKNQEKDMSDLKSRFNESANGEKRNFAFLAFSKPALVEKAINNGTVNALRCIEIATGSPLTEKEKTASKENEINKECPSLANPSYKLSK